MRNAACAAILAAIMLIIALAGQAVPAFAAPVPEERGGASAPSAAPGEKKPLGHLAEFTDVEAYKFLVLAARTPWTAPSNYKPESWKNNALGYVVSWMEFIERYPNSPLVSHAYLRMAEWYLTIKKGDGEADWALRERQRNADPEEIKNKPEVLDPVYVTEALKLLNRVIERFPNDPYLAHVGSGEFAWNDKVGAVALYMRGLLFRGGCKQDLARLRRDYPDSPLTRDAAGHFAKVCFQ